MILKINYEQIIVMNTTFKKNIYILFNLEARLRHPRECRAGPNMFTTLKILSHLDCGPITQPELSLRIKQGCQY